jgi:hypothetical protein
LYSLWHEVPSTLSTHWFNDCKKRLRELWEKTYKEREINGESQQLAATYSDYTSLRFQFRHALGNHNQPQNNGRHRRRPNITQIQDELDQYLSEPQVLESLHNGGDPMTWWRDVGSRRFPRLCFLAADLLSIPPSTGNTEREFNGAGGMITAKRSSLSPYIVNQARCLSSWHQTGSYVATEPWQRLRRTTSSGE